MPSEKRVIIVGGGLAGLMTAVTACEKGASVDLVSYVPVRRSHSVCAQGGINGAVNTKGEGDSPDFHFDDTIYGGDFLASQPMVRDMCYAAPKMIYLLDRMGVPFNRTPEGLLDFRRFGGTLFNRTAFAGATTGQQLLYALDEQVRRFEADGEVRKFEHHSFQSLILDGQQNCRGVVIADQQSLKCEALRGDAVVMATGGIGMIFGKTTNSVICTGSAASRCYQQGAWYANGEFIQVHPTAIPGTDKNRLISESVRGEGGRVWVPKTAGDPRKGKDIPVNERLYFLEEKYPAYGNLVPRDIATRELFDICVNGGMGVGGRREVYLDVTHIPEAKLRAKLAGVLEIYEKFMGEDPYHNPMRVFPAMHYTMGGMYVGYGTDTNLNKGLHADCRAYKHMSNIRGLFVGGEADSQYHGANRLGANSLLSCLWAGQVIGPEAVKYLENAELPAYENAHAAGEVAQQEEAFEAVFRLDGSENAFRLNDELADAMNVHCTVVRRNDGLKMLDAKLDELLERSGKIGLGDRSRYTNQEAFFIRELRDRILLGKVICRGALQRNESRGAHYKPDFPQRDDANWLKTTVAQFNDGAPLEPKYSFEDVDTSLIVPRLRSYTKASHGGSEAKDGSSGVSAGGSAQAEPGPRNTPPTAESLHGAAPAAQTVKGEQTATGANTAP
jgi:succinate dehydrogenase / fumarate reductase, flavoprotein subunit